MCPTQLSTKRDIFAQFGVISSSGYACERGLVRSDEQLIDAALRKVMNVDLVDAAVAWMHTGAMDLLPAESRVLEQNGLTRSYFGIHLLAEPFARISDNLEMRRFASYLVGEELSLYQSHLNLKPARSGGHYSFHRDANYFEGRDGVDEVDKFVGGAIGLARVAPHAGPLVSLLGSHQGYLSDRVAGAAEYTDLRHDDANDPGVLKGRELAATLAYDEHVWTCERGDVLWFDTRVVHGSAQNLSSIGRPMLFLFFGPRRCFPKRTKQSNPFMHEVSV